MLGRAGRRGHARSVGRLCARRRRPSGPGHTGRRRRQRLGHRSWPGTPRRRATRPWWPFRPRPRPRSERSSGRRPPRQGRSAGVVRPDVTVDDVYDADVANGLHFGTFGPSKPTTTGGPGASSTASAHPSDGRTLRNLRGDVSAPDGAWSTPAGSRGQRGTRGAIEEAIKCSASRRAALALAAAGAKTAVASTPSTRTTSPTAALSASSQPAV